MTRGGEYSRDRFEDCEESYMPLRGRKSCDIWRSEGEQRGKSIMRSEARRVKKKCWVEHETTEKNGWETMGEL